MQTVRFCDMVFTREPFSLKLFCHVLSDIITFGFPMRPIRCLYKPQILCYDHDMVTLTVFNASVLSNYIIFEAVLYIAYRGNLSSTMHSGVKGGASHDKC